MYFHSRPLQFRTRSGPYRAIASKNTPDGGPQCALAAYVEGQNRQGMLKWLKLIAHSKLPARRTTWHAAHHLVLRTASFERGQRRRDHFLPQIQHYRSPERQESHIRHLQARTGALRLAGSTRSMDHTHSLDCSPPALI